VSWEALASENILGIRPYVPGKPVEELGREMGWTDLQSIVKVASNENPLGPSPAAMEAVRGAIGNIHRYPESGAYYLRHRLAEIHQLAPEQFIFGNGSNEVLVLLGNALLRPGLELLASQHAFLVYRLVAAMFGADYVEVPASNYGHDLDAIVSAISDRTRMICLANPNNPTGTMFKKDEFLRFLERVPDHVVIVLDEAYAEYVDEPDYPNGLQLLDRHSKLVVTRTFSKIFGLAGLRIGYGVLSSEGANLLGRVRQPFNVNNLAQVGAHAALFDEDHIQRSKRVNADGMLQIEERLKQMGLSWIPSYGNFLLVEVGDGARVCNDMLPHGVIARPVANYGLPQFLRLSVGTEAENDRALNVLREVLAL
jgi:histidinol-phosphate aminotransferase